jgi:hypothetical protein
MRKDELELLERMQKTTSSGRPQRSQKARRPPPRYINRRDVAKTIRQHYTKNMPVDDLEKYMGALEQDAVDDPLIRKFATESDLFTDEEGPDTDEEKSGRNRASANFSDTESDSDSYSDSDDEPANSSRHTSTSNHRSAIDDAFPM